MAEPQTGNVIDPETVNGVFGQKLRMLRRQRDLSQAEIAEQVGVSRVTIANLESGKQNVQLHQLVNLARALDVSPERLMPTAIELESNSSMLPGVRPDLLANSDLVFLKWAKSNLTRLAE